MGALEEGASKGLFVKDAVIKDDGPKAEQKEGDKGKEKGEEKKTATGFTREEMTDRVGLYLLQVSL